MLYYLPLEAYMERYTYFMSCENGWAENHFKKNNVEFIRIDGEPLSSTIDTGKVLDCYGRSYFAMSQIMKLVKLLKEGKLTNADVIYVEDFWHPGIESLFYIRHLSGINFKIGTFLHAQSVDNTDFAYAMRDWMRPIEVGYGKGFDFIFVCSAILKQLCIEGGIGTEDSIHVIGLPYNSTRLKEQLVAMGMELNQDKEDYVLFASRFDDEKDPMFFLDLVERCPDIQFRLVCPRKVITSNQQVLDRLYSILDKDNSNLKLIDTSKSKLDYYNALAKAKIVFNCADQDWVSWTLLECCTFKCNPLYPKWKDFPLELNYNENYLYEKRNLDECEQKLRKLLVKDFDETLQAVVDKHDKSWHNYLEIMGVI